MLKPRLFIWIISVGMMVPGAGVVSGQNYPNRPIRMVTSEVGGTADFTARAIAQELTANLGQQVIVENRGGIGSIRIQIVIKAPPDGYTLLLSGNVLWVLPLMQKVEYDPVRDFSPVSLAVSQPLVLVVHPSLAVKSVKELIVLAKSKPGELNYASGAPGGPTPLAGYLFNAMAGVNIMHVFYKGSGPGLNSLIGGEVQVMFPAAGGAAAHIKSGRLRALAVTSAQPSALLPGLPTVAAAGLPGYELVAPYGVFVPAKTPGAIINRLNREIVRTLNGADVKERFFNAGAETVGSSPEQFSTFVKADLARLGKVIKEAGIRGE